MNPKPVSSIPPIRMGDRSDLVRKQKAKAEAQQKTEAKIRTRIYQDILTLLDIADRLTLDFSGQVDRYGLDWYSLARQVNAHYKADVLKIIPGLQSMIMSKEGAQGLPKGTYRQLLDFVEECREFTKWAQGPTGEEVSETQPASPFQQACKRFHKACAEMQQQICIFENERGAEEESFFG